MAHSESWFLRSDNIDIERDPDKINWHTLPAGDEGLRSPCGSIAEEVNLTSLSDGSLFCTYRTVAGHPCHAYSRDDGATWTSPAFMTYNWRDACQPSAPGSLSVALPRVLRSLYWFHNHKGHRMRAQSAYCWGVEVDSSGKLIKWDRQWRFCMTKPATRQLSRFHLG